MLLYEGSSVSCQLKASNISSEEHQAARLRIANAQQCKNQRSSIMVGDTLMLVLVLVPVRVGHLSEVPRLLDFRSA
jgi:hypothetical protein